MVMDLNQKIIHVLKVYFYILIVKMFNHVGNATKVVKDVRMNLNANLVLIISIDIFLVASVITVSLIKMVLVDNQNAKKMSSLKQLKMEEIILAKNVVIIV